MSGYTESIFSQSMAGFFHESKSAVLDYRMRQDLVSKSRVILTKVPLARAIIDVLVRGVVGSGLHLGAYDPAWETYGELKGLDARGELDFYQLQQLVWQTALTCGEAILVRQIDDSEQYSHWLLAEPDHVMNPPTVTADVSGNFYYKRHLLIDGIEYANNGTPYAMHYCVDPYTRGVFDKRNWRRIFFKDKDGQQNIIHVRLMDRAEYGRGLPVLAPLLETLYGLYAFQTAQIQMGIVQSCQAFVVKTESPEKSLNPFAGRSRADLNAPLVPEEDHEAEQSEFTIIPPNERDVFGMTSTPSYISAGQSYHLGVGESIEHLATTGPSNSLTEYYDLVLAQCAAALGIPKAILSNIFDTSFSSCKASIAQWNFTISRYRKAFIAQCIRPMYLQYLREAHTGWDEVEIARVALSSVWKSVDPPMFADESKTMAFYAQAIELGLITRDEAAQALFGHKAEGTPAPE